MRSIIEIRRELTAGLKRVGDKSPAKEAFRVMRAACRDFLNHPVMQDGGQGMLHQRGVYQPGGVSTWHRQAAFHIWPANRFAN